jgi:hypothetical protein
MEELIDFCESEADRLDHQMAHGYYEFPGSNYRSVITFEGQPILPPLVSFIGNPRNYILNIWVIFVKWLKDYNNYNGLTQYIVYHHF